MPLLMAAVHIERIYTESQVRGWGGGGGWGGGVFYGTGELKLRKYFPFLGAFLPSALPAKLHPHSWCLR